MRISDPKLVYFRMMQDAARLKDWADRMGNESHKAFATELERILVLKQALFTADLPTTKTKVMQKAVDAESKEDAVRKAQLAVVSNQSLSKNPFPAGSELYAEWRKGWYFYSSGAPGGNQAYYTYIPPEDD